MSQKKKKVRLTHKEKLLLQPNEKLILFYRLHPVEATRDLLGVELTWFQRLALKAVWKNKYVMFLWGRGVGKSFMFAIISVLKMLLYPNTKIGIVAPVYRQAEYVFDYIEFFWQTSAYIRASCPRGTSRAMYRSILKAHNGSFIEALPVGDGSKIRGRRYNIVLIDEYAQMDEKIIKMVIRPMLSVRQKQYENQLIIASTAFYTWNHLYTQYLLFNLMKKRRPGVYEVLEFDYLDVMNTKDSPFMMDEDFIEAQRLDMIEEEFDMEYLCKFPHDIQSFISPKLIDECTPKLYEGSPIEYKAESGYDYVMGVDCARVEGGDNFSLSIFKLDKGERRLVKVVTMNGATYQRMTNAIRLELELFPIKRINIDSGGGGMTLKDLLAESWINSETKEKCLPIIDMEDKDYEKSDGLKILKMVNFTRQSVNDMFMGLKADMQHRRIMFPMNVIHHNDKNLEGIMEEIIHTKRELMLLQAEPKGNFYEFSVPEKYKKDRAVSLALADMAANDLFKNEQVTMKELEAVGFWI